MLSLGLDSLSTYGLLKGESADQIRQYLETLEGAGYLHTETEHSTLRFTERTGEVLFQGATVTMTHRKTETLPAKGKAPKPAKAPQADEALLDRLKKVRVRVAKEAGLPLYLVFSNATLADMARRRPRTLEEFLEVSGVGEVKADKYGPAFLRALAVYEEGEV